MPGIRRSAEAAVALPVTDARGAQRALALVRIVVGAWFAKGAVTKLSWTLVGGVLPLPTASARWAEVMPRLLRGYAESTPVGWYAEFVHGVVLPHPSLFAHLTAFGETVVGLGLLFGLLTPYVSAAGLLLVANYGLVTLGAGNCQPGFHLVLATAMVACIAGSAGREWGLDGWWARRRRSGGQPRAAAG